MALSHFEITAARPKDRPFKLADGDGLHLLVQPNGKKFWRFRYQFAGVEKMMALGSYPATSLAEARTRRDEARKLIEAGSDPSVQKKLARLANEAASRNTFKLIAAEHVAHLKANGAAQVTAEKHRWLLEDVAASIGNRPITDITSAELLELLKRVEKSGRRETAKRLRATISTVFRLAIALKVAVGSCPKPFFEYQAAIAELKRLKP